MDQAEVGRFIRARREALQPEDIGLRPGSRRRTVGLRREEVADLSDMSADYLARLERGSGPQPSAQMVGALARGLRLTLDERDYLLRLADHPLPARLESNSHVSPGLMRILDRLTDTPAQVMGPLGETLAQNSTAVVLFGDETSYSGFERSAVYRWFTNPAARSLYRPEDQEHQARVQVSLLREATARLGSASTDELIRNLTKLSPDFEHLWKAVEVGVRHSEQKHFRHPEVGDLNLHCQMVIDPDQLQTLLVLTATPASESAEKLRMLSIIGTYRVAPR
jgi:transcriptional regulator with XRE-family HTH domain